MKSLLKFFRGYRKDSFLAPLFKLIEVGFELLVPIVVAAIIDKGIATKDTRFIITRALILCAFAIAGFCSAVIAQYFAARSAVGVTCKVRSALFSHIQTLSARDIDQFGTSSAITRLTSDLNNFQNGVNLFLRLFLRSPFVVFGALICAFLIDSFISLIFLCVIIVLAIVVFAIILITKPLYKKSSQKLEGVVEGVREQISGARVQRAFGREEVEANNSTSKEYEYSRFTQFVGKISSLLNPLTWLCVNLGIIALVWSGAWKVEGGLLTQGALIALYNYMSQILVELLKLANLIIQISRALASASRIENLFEKENTMRDGDVTTISSKCDIKFEHVYLKYNEGGVDSLEDISLTIPAGSTLGVIGPTGSGKTTFAHLINRLYDTTSGEVTIGGINICDYSLRTLHNSIGYVPQKPILFEGSVADNLRFAKRDATDDEISTALRIAQCDDFASAQTQINDKASNLSGGQKQRISIARALVSNPKILIFDDSSSALDNLTESKLWDAIKSLEHIPTRIIISQKVSSVASCDQILCLEDGQAVGIGTHEQLYQNCPTYHEICEVQK